MADLNKMLEEVKAMTVVELNEFVKMLETEFGVSAAAMAMAAPTGAAEAPVEEEKSEYALVLKEVGGNKIAVIKVAREITGLGLGEAKALVDAAPKTLKEGLSKQTAEEFKKKLEEAGAVAELK